MSEAGHDFDALVVRYLDGVMTAEEFAAIDRLLRGDVERQRAFIELALTRRALCESLRAVVRAEPRVAAAQSPLRSAFRVRRYLLAAAVLIAGVAAGVYLTTMNGGQIVTDRAAPLVASLTHAESEVSGQDSPIGVGSELTPQTIQTGDGEAELLLRSNTMVTVSGPTRLRLDSPMHVGMLSGSATFDCPPTAKGFTVELPGGARVVDLGTRFRVVVGPAGDASVHVLEGLVEMNGEKATDATRRFVDAGSTVRWINGRLIEGDADIAAASPDRVLNIDLGGRGTYRGPGVASTSATYWNSLPGEVGATLLAADGVTPLPITVSTTTSAAGARPGQPIALFDDYVFNHSAQGPWIIRLDGLDDARTYNLILYAGTALRQGSSYTVGGQTLAVTGDRTDAFAEGVNYARFTALRPVAGRIEITVSKPDEGAYMCAGLQLIEEPTKLTTPTAAGTANPPRTENP